MNKGNKILIAILAFIVVCVVGYALFSDSITITGTATADGDWSITASCTSGTDSVFNDYYIDSTGNSNSIIEGEYTGEYCNVNGTEVSFGANLKMPGARKIYTIKLKNSGSITATINVEDDIILTEQTCWDEDANGSYEKCQDDLSMFVDLDVVGFVSSNGTKVAAGTSGMSEFYDEDTGLVVLEPGEELVVYVVSDWSTSYDTDGFNNVAFKTVTNVDFNFSQLSE